MIGAAINATLIYVVNNLLAWDLLPFLTSDFDRVVGLVTVSLGAGVVCNGAYVVHDGVPFKPLCEIVMAGISMVVTVRVLQVFPFDFSAYEFEWGTLARVILIAAIVGIAIGILVELSRLARWLGRT